LQLPAAAEAGGDQQDEGPREARIDPAGDPAPTLDLEIAPQDLGRLLRAPALLARRTGRARSRPADMVWHDSAQGDLAARALCLSQIRGPACEHWRLERLQPNGVMDWLPARTAPILAEAASPEALAAAAPSRRLPSPLLPVAAFKGRLREYHLRDESGPARLAILDGSLRGVAEDRPACRLILSGEPAAMAGIARELSDGVRLSIPRQGLAAQALQLARGVPPAARQLGGPAIPAGLPVGEALVFVIAHLADVILHWSALIGRGGTPEPVHQCRVGVRRLRSALSVFGRAVPDAGGGDWRAELRVGLKDLAARLGAARDWDVFLTETGADIRLAFPAERRIDQLLGAAARKRSAAYESLADFFAGVDWPRLEMTLALLPTLRPWLKDVSPDAAERLGAPIAPFAAAALGRRLKHLVQPGPDIAGLPAAQLHEIRKQAKRLSYGIELFAPSFAEKNVRRYLERLERLQGVLGLLNDGAVAASLTAQLGGGADRAFAAGVVQGYSATRAIRARSRVQRAWDKLYRATPFWD
jgi:CHAD domain-containing protein